MLKNLTIPIGFGSRLREERVRLTLSQAEFAASGGVKRLTQSQYEKEASSPTIQYLAALTLIGVNLDYLIFGRVAAANLLLSEDRLLIDGEAFRQMEKFTQNQPNCKLESEGRFALFQAFRTNLIRESLKIPTENGLRRLPY